MMITNRPRKCHPIAESPSFGALERYSGRGETSHREKRKCGGGLLAMTLATHLLFAECLDPPSRSEKGKSDINYHGNGLLCCSRARGMPSRYRQVYHVFRQGPRLCQCKSSRLGKGLQLEAGIAARSCSLIPREFFQLQ